MDTVIPADELLLSMNEMIEKHSSSLLDFATEQKNASDIVTKQHDKVNQLQKLHQEMTNMLNQSDTTIETIKTMKEHFNQVHKEYMDEYLLLKEIYLTISVSFKTEKDVLKHCFFVESEQALSKIIEKTTDQNLLISQFSENIQVLGEA